MRKKKRESDSALVADMQVKSYVPPVMTHYRRAEIERAARLHATAHNSDPFARPRILTHMRRGIDLPSEVILEAQRLLEIRQRAKAYA